MATNEFISYLLHGNGKSFAGLNNMPTDQWFPIANTSFYKETCMAFKRIMDLRIDLHWGYELELGGAPNESAIIFKDYLPTKFRKLIPDDKIMENFRASLQQNNYICRITQKNDQPDMATKKTKDKTPVAALITVPTDAAVDVFYQQTKEEVQAKLVAVKAITSITTHEEAEAAVKTAKELDVIFKKVEDVRTTLKAPFLAAGKVIDARAKMATDGVESELNRVKALLLKFREAKQAEDARKAAEAEAARKAEEQKAINETAQVHSSVAFLESKCMEIYQKLSDVKVWVDVVKIFHAEFSPDAWAKHAASYAGFEEQAGNVRLQLVEFGKVIDQNLKAIAESADGSQERQKAYLNISLAKSSFEKGMFEFFSALKGQAVEKVEQVALAAEMNKAQITAAVINSAPEKVVSTHKTVDFEMVSVEEVINAGLSHLLIIDRVAVNNMLSDPIGDGTETLRDKIKRFIDMSPNGFYQSKGVKFFYKESVKL